MFLGLMIIIIVHLRASLFISTLYVEAFLVRRTVKDCLRSLVRSTIQQKDLGYTYLIATNLLRNMIQRLKKLDSQLLPLLIRFDSYIFNMALRS
jgi:hypothetical protein